MTIDDLDPGIVVITVTAATLPLEQTYSLVVQGQFDGQLATPYNPGWDHTASTVHLAHVPDPDAWRTARWLCGISIAGACHCQLLPLLLANGLFAGCCAAVQPADVQCHRAIWHHQRQLRFVQLRCQWRWAVCQRPAWLQARCRHGFRTFCAAVSSEGCHACHQVRHLLVLG